MSAFAAGAARALPLFGLPVQIANRKKDTGRENCANNQVSHFDSS